MGTFLIRPVSMVPRQLNWNIFWIESPEFILIWIEFWVSNIELNHFLPKIKHWIEPAQSSTRHAALYENVQYTFCTSSFGTHGTAHPLWLAWGLHLETTSLSIQQTLFSFYHYHFITPNFFCFYQYHHSAFDCHEALIFKHLLSIFIFDIQYSHTHNYIGYSRSLLFKPMIWCLWTQNSFVPNLSWW